MKNGHYGKKPGNEHGAKILKSIQCQKIATYLNYNILNLSQNFDKKKTQEL